MVAVPDSQLKVGVCVDRCRIKDIVSLRMIFLEILKLRNKKIVVKVYTCVEYIDL